MCICITSAVRPHGLECGSMKYTHYGIAGEGAGSARDDDRHYHSHHSLPHTDRSVKINQFERRRTGAGKCYRSAEEGVGHGAHRGRSG
jgi:hypothetical protein